MKLAFVTPWYGLDIPGGAEAECRKTAEHLSESFPVEILTTCVRDFHSDWNRNFHREGTDLVNGVPVRRFPVRKSNAKLYESLNSKVINDQPLSEREAEIFFEESIRSDRLIEYMRNHRNDYLFIFIPYLFGTTYWGAQVCPERSILIPCLHDEGYAYLKRWGPIFRQAKGVIFHSEAEMRLAAKLYELKPESMALLGEGIDADFHGDANRFQKKYGLRDFILYAGRKDELKNVPLLIDYFGKFLQNPQRSKERDAKLVLIGSGQVSVPEKLKKHVLDLGFVSDADRADAYAASLVLCQPSIHESFSLPLMESWLAGRPVLVNSACAVTRQHCEASGGGLSFFDCREFEESLEFLLEDSDTRRKMGERGKKYVLENYRWEKVMQRYLQTFSRWGIAL
ncbi:MAG TPA: hexosyltransferase [Cyanobacteria bacterium UBA8530]|nr:hexosyltransferase [Cyanobacteria bacterium UBA8530]